LRKSIRANVAVGAVCLAIWINFDDKSIPVTVCPAVQKNHEDQNCEPRLYQTTVIVKTIDERKVTEFSSNINGEFKIKLAPGNYWLEAADQSKLPHLVPTPVDVEANKFENITLRFDTGIR